MGEEGPKGDMGEKVRKFHFTFHILGTCTEQQQGLAVAGKHKGKKKRVNVSHLRGDLWRAAEVTEVKCHQL